MSSVETDSDVYKTLLELLSSQAQWPDARRVRRFSQLTNVAPTFKTEHLIQGVSNMCATFNLNTDVIGLIAKAQGCVARALKSKKQSLM